MTSPSALNLSEPPYYVLVSHTLTLPSAGTTTFSHPTIEYHYADDSPHNLLPRSADEHVIVLDYDPTSSVSPTAQCLSSELAVKGVKVADAPGAGSATAEDGPRNNKIFVIETSITPPEIPEADDQQVSQAILAEFKHRNTVIREILDYPKHVAVSDSLPVLNGTHLVHSPSSFTSPPP